MESVTREAPLRNRKFGGRRRAVSSPNVDRCSMTELRSIKCQPNGFSMHCNSGMKFDFEKRYSRRTPGMYKVFFYRATLCVKRGTNR